MRRAWQVPRQRDLRALKWLSPGGQVNPKAQVSKDTGQVPRLCILELLVSELQETDPSDPGRNRREPQNRHVTVPGLMSNRARPDSSQSQAWTPSMASSTKVTAGVTVPKAGHLLLGDLIQ